MQTLEDAMIPCDASTTSTQFIGGRHYISIEDSLEILLAVPELQEQPEFKGRKELYEILISQRNAKGNPKCQ